MTHASRLLEQLKVAADDDELGKEMKARVESHIDELETDDE